MFSGSFAASIRRCCASPARRWSVSSETPPRAGGEFRGEFRQGIRGGDGLECLRQIDVRRAARGMDRVRAGERAGGTGDFVAPPGSGPAPEDRRAFAAEEVERLRTFAAGEVLSPDAPAAFIVAGEPGLEQFAGSGAMPERAAMEGTAGGLVRKGDGHGIRFQEVDGRV